MAIKSMRVPVPMDFVFPDGALAIGVEPLRDWGTPGDSQATDKDTGLPLWSVLVMDLDPDAARFGRQNVKVKVASRDKPALPVSMIPGYPPAIVFVDLVASPWVDQRACTGPTDGRPHKCRANQGYSLRASGVQPAGDRASDAGRAA